MRIDRANTLNALCSRVDLI